MLVRWRVGRLHGGFIRRLGTHLWKTILAACGDWRRFVILATHGEKQFFLTQRLSQMLKIVRICQICQNTSTWNPKRLCCNSWSEIWEVKCEKT